jgi:hypothetical protein
LWSKDVDGSDDEVLSDVEEICLEINIENPPEKKKVENETDRSSRDSENVEKVEDKVSAKKNVDTKESERKKRDTETLSDSETVDSKKSVGILNTSVDDYCPPDDVDDVIINFFDGNLTGKNHYFVMFKTLTFPKFRLWVFFS